jgi:hypothetical protein
MGKEGLEPSHLSVHDPKSCLSASSSTSPGGTIISQTALDCKKKTTLINQI